MKATIENNEIVIRLSIDIPEKFNIPNIRIYNFEKFLDWVLRNFEKLFYDAIVDAYVVGESWAVGKNTDIEDLD